MSSDEDSETAEWEREQMLRGTQSRGQKYHQPRSERNSDVVDASIAKRHINQDIEKTDMIIESIKKDIGTTRLDIVRSEKKIDSIKRHIEELESFNALFEEIATLNDSDKILAFLAKYKSIIVRLPHDQREMIDLLERKAKDNQPPMDVDQ